jgi:uncharacterized protein YfaP (DUF2135 family)
MAQRWSVFAAVVCAAAGIACSSGEGDGSDAGTSPTSDGGTDGGLSGTAPTAFPDPAPQFTRPGEYGCAGCPDSAADTFTRALTAVTTTTLAGTIQGAVGNGRWYVQSASGQAFGGELPTSADTGDFDLNVPLFCGTQLVKCLWSNETGNYVQVIEVVVSDCVEPDLRVTTSWDEAGQDLELHLVRPGGRINGDGDCTWTSCVGQSPDWGVAGDPTDNPLKDVDDTGPFGPENVLLAKPESGTYHVLVEYWSTGAPSTGRVVIQLKGKTWVQEIVGLQPKQVWQAATIRWPEGVVTTGTETFDCSGSWSSGCTAALP